MGKRILVTTFGSYGDLHPYITLASALAARGHEVTLATSASYRGRVEAAGIAFHAVRPDGDLDDQALVARIMDRRTGTELLLRELLLPAIRETYEDLSAAAVHADLIVTHPATYAGPIVAQVQRLPWVSTMLAPMGFFSVHEPPVMPPAPWLKRIDRFPPVARGLVALARRITRDWSRPVYELRRELGLSRGGDPIFEGQHSPQRVLCLFSRVLAEPQPDWPPQAVITGHLFHDQSAPVPAELTAFLERGAPPLVFTLGSSATAAAGRFYHESIEAAQLLGRRAVLLVGQNRFDEALPVDVVAVPYAPHDQVFPRAAAIVHQAGIGTLAQALRAGRPMLIAPFAHDQPDNAWRAERLGIAATLYPERYTARRAGRLLRRLLDDPAVQARAAHVAAAVRAEDGVGTACALIEAELGQGGA